MMDWVGFEPTASTLRRCKVIRRNEVLEYIRIVELKGLCDRHIYEMKRFLNKYLEYVDYKIDKSKSIEYFGLLKNKYCTSAYRKQVYQILKFLRHFKINWSDEIKLPPEPYYLPKNLTINDINTTLKYFNDKEYYLRVKALILLGSTSGMRAEEIYQLSLENINLSKRTININHNPKNGQSTKNRRSRLSFITIDAQKALIDYIEYFKNSSYKVLFTQGHIERLFRNAPIKVKDLRKYFSQEWDRRGGPTSIKKILMGHSLKGDVDLMHYNYQSEEDLKQIYDKVMGKGSGLGI
jgi:integrase/recombinase XerD